MERIDTTTSIGAVQWQRRGLNIESSEKPDSNPPTLCNANAESIFIYTTTVIDLTHLNAISSLQAILINKIKISVANTKHNRRVNKSHHTKAKVHLCLGSSIDLFVTLLRNNYRDLQGIWECTT